MGLNEDFESLYDTLFPDVYSYFNMCFGETVAEDLSQEIFMRVWNTLKNGKSPDNWRAWIFRCTVNMKNDYFRKKYSQADNCEIAAHLAENCQDDLQSIQIQKAFQNLENADKELLFLKAEGFTSEEIGELLGLSASAVRTRLQKSKQLFETELEREGITV